MILDFLGFTSDFPGLPRVGGLFAARSPMGEALIGSDAKQDAKILIVLPARPLINDSSSLLNSYRSRADLRSCFLRQALMVLS